MLCSSAGSPSCSRCSVFLLVPSTIFRSLAAGAILVAIVSVIAALTPFPAAVLALLGDRGTRSAFRTSDARRAGAAGRAASGRARRGGHAPSRLEPRARRRTAPSRSRRLCSRSTRAPRGRRDAARPLRVEAGLPAAQRRTSEGPTDPVEIAVAGEVETPPIGSGALEQELADWTIFGEPAVETNEAGTVARVTVLIAGDANGTRAIEAVRDLRGDVVPRVFAGTDAQVYVGGGTAEELDYHDTVDDWLPLVLLFVLGLSFVLLTIAFRLASRPGDGGRPEPTRWERPWAPRARLPGGRRQRARPPPRAETIDAWVPLFSRSSSGSRWIRHQVFLLSRIRERWQPDGRQRRCSRLRSRLDRTDHHRAALIIIAVFWGFAMGDTIAFQQMGFGVAVALLIDATIVRSVLVPATMKLLGKRNWYLPSWLTWLPRRARRRRRGAAEGRAQAGARRS